MSISRIYSSTWFNSFHCSSLAKYLFESYLFLIKSYFLCVSSSFPLSSVSLSFFAFPSTHPIKVRDSAKVLKKPRFKISQLVALWADDLWWVTVREIIPCPIFCSQHASPALFPPQKYIENPNFTAVKHQSRCFQT